MDFGLSLPRREFMGAAAIGLLASCTALTEGSKSVEETYGLIGQINALPGKRDELLKYLYEGTRDMPGNLAYIIGEDLADPDALWVTEVWRTRTDHENSLKLASVQAAIAKGRPLIAGFGTRAETRPVGL